MTPALERLLFYHFFVDGSCIVKLDGLPPVQVQAGDIILFPYGDAHTMASSGADGRGPLLDVQTLLRDRPDELQLGGGGEPTRIICGYLSCDPILCRPLLTALPRVVTVTLRDEKTDWLERSFVYAVAQAAGAEPGGEGVLAKLSEVLVVETLRRYISRMPEGQTGWLAGSARSRRGQVPRAHAREAGASMDARKPGARSGHLALGAGREVHSLRRTVADSISRRSGAWRSRRTCCDAAPRA